MVSHEELELYFYIACGVTGIFILVIFIFIIVLCVKVSRLSRDDFYRYRSNQLGRQASMMAEFCYTNPAIVPGEELSRRGYSMYSGSNNYINDYGTRGYNKYGTHNHDVNLSKF